MENITPAMASTDPLDLHNLVLDLAPLAITDLTEHMSKSTRFVIACLRHDKDSEPLVLAPRQDQFVWVKGRSKVTVRDVLKAYTNRCEVVDLEVELRVGAWTPDLDLRMDQLGSSQDRHIVFSAHVGTQSDVSAPIPPETPRSAMRSSGQLAKSRTPTLIPSRQPLQPVNRQLSVQDKHSAESPGKRIVKPEPPRTPSSRCHLHRSLHRP